MAAIKKEAVQKLEAEIEGLKLELERAYEACAEMENQYIDKAAEVEDLEELIKSEPLKAKITDLFYREGQGLATPHDTLWHLSELLEINEENLTETFSALAEYAGRRNEMVRQCLAAFAVNEGAE